MEEIQSNAPRRIFSPRSPLVPAAVAMVAGILVGRYAALPVGVWMAAGVAAFLTAVFTVRREHLRELTTAAIAVAVGLTSAGWVSLAYYHIQPDHIVTFSGRGSVLATIRGRIVSKPRLRRPRTPYWRPARTSFLLDAETIGSTNGEWLETSGTVRVTVGEPAWDLSSGQQVELVGSLRRFRPPGNPGQYDWKAAERNKGIFVRFFVPGADGVRVQSGFPEGLFSRFWGRVRLLAREHLSACGQEDQAVLLEALVLGERSPALRELNQVMVDAGIAHFLSISGLHLGIFLGFVYWVCRLAALRPNRAAWVVLIILIGYVLLAEPRAPLLRAAIMAGAIAVAVITGREASSPNALAAAAVILLLIDPLQLFQPGFQLSFGIVCGIIVLHKPIRRLLFGRWLRRRGLMVFGGDRRLRRWLYYRGADSFISLVSLSLAAYVSAAPLVAYHFGLFCPYAPLLSIPLLPLLVAVLIPAYLSMMIAFVTPNLAWIIGSAAAGAAGGMRSVVMLLEHLPGLSIDLYTIPVWCVVLFYLATALWVAARRSRIVFSAASVATVGLLAGIVVTQLPARPAAWHAGPAGRLHVLDVAHGSMTLLHAPDGRTYLFDAGTLAPTDAYNQILRPFLRAKRLPSPEAVFISHANIDHYNAISGLLTRNTPRRVYLNEFFGRREDDPPAVRELLTEFKRRNVQIIRLRAGQTVSLGESVSVEVLWPPGPGGTVKPNAVRLGRGMHSLVARVKPNAVRLGRDSARHGQAVSTAKQSLTVPPAEALKLDVNNSSLVLRVVCSRRSVIIPGDIGDLVLREMLRRAEPAETHPAKLPAGEIHCDALILPHHGSATPTLKTFIEAVNPKILVQSSSFRPDPPDLLKAIGDRRRYATFRDGWIGLTLGAGGVTVETMRKD